MKQPKVEIVENRQPKKHVGLKRSKPNIVHIIKKLIAGPSLFRSTEAKDKKRLIDLKRRMKLIASLGRANSGMCKFNYKKNSHIGFKLLSPRSTLRTLSRILFQYSNRDCSQEPTKIPSSHGMMAQSAL